MRLGAAVAAMLLWMSTTGCGYHSAGHAVRIPESVHTISVPTFVNQTQSYKVEQILTAAVVRELNTRTKYHIDSDEKDSDAVLRGVVTSTQLAPLTYDSQTGRASSALVTVTMRVSLVDRSGRLLYSNSEYVFREQYQVSRELTSFFDESGPAIDRVSRDFARTLVSNILEAF